MKYRIKNKHGYLRRRCWCVKIHVFVTGEWCVVGRFNNKRDADYFADCWYFENDIPVDYVDVVPMKFTIKRGCAQ